MEFFAAAVVVAADVIANVMVAEAGAVMPLAIVVAVAARIAIVVARPVVVVVVILFAGSVLEAIAVAADAVARLVERVRAIAVVSAAAIAISVAEQIFHFATAVAARAFVVVGQRRVRVAAHVEEVANLIATRTTGFKVSRSFVGLALPRLEPREIAGAFAARLVVDVMAVTAVVAKLRGVVTC